MNIGQNKILYKLLFINNSTDLDNLGCDIISNIEGVIISNLGLKNKAIEYIDFILNILNNVELIAYCDNVYKLNELKQNVLKIKNSLTAEATTPIVTIDKFEKYKGKEKLTINEVMDIFNIKSRKSIYDNEGIYLPNRISDKNKKVYFDKNEVIECYNNNNNNGENSTDLMV